MNNGKLRRAMLNKTHKHVVINFNRQDLEAEFQERQSFPSGTFDVEKKGFKSDCIVLHQKFENDL